MGRRHATDADSTLTPLMFQILVALSQGTRHGYAIMKEIETRTGGSFGVGAGSLYRSIRQLVDAKFIVEIEEKDPTHPQRRLYRITQEGLVRAGSDARVFREIAEWAREAPLPKPHET